MTRQFGGQFGLFQKALGNRAAMDQGFSRFWIAEPVFQKEILLIHPPGAFDGPVNARPSVRLVRIG